MELSVNINIEQLIQLIRKLPLSERERVLNELEKHSQEGVKNTRKSFKNFLLKAPIMSDEEHKQFVENRKRLIKWRAK